MTFIVFYGIINYTMKEGNKMFEKTILSIVKPLVKQASFFNGTLFFTTTSDPSKVFDAIRKESGCILPHMQLTKQFSVHDMTEWAIDF